MAKFDAEYYRQFRPYYPVTTFAGLQNTLLTRGLMRPFRVADIGCGTGHSAISLLKSGFDGRIIGIDPDEKMLAQARRLTELHQMSEIEFQLGSAEALPISSGTIDAVLIGSAFHWFEWRRTSEEMLRILKPQGVLRIFEYQFPKAPDCPALNEWIRRQFNLNWKAPQQKPRGSFFQMTEVFRKDARWASLGQGKPPMVMNLTGDDLAGHLFSQSRVLCYEETLPSAEKAVFRAGVRKTVCSFFQEKTLAFDFKLSWFEFGKR